MENAKKLEQQLHAVYLQQQQLAKQEIVLRDEIRKEQNKENQYFTKQICTELLRLIQESDQIEFLTNLDHLLDAEDNRVIMATLEHYLQLDAVRNQIVKVFFQDTLNHIDKDNNDDTVPLQEILNRISKAVHDKYAQEDSNNYVYPVELMYPNATIGEIQTSILANNNTESLDSVDKVNINKSQTAIPSPIIESTDAAKEPVYIPRERGIKKMFHQAKDSIAEIFKSQGGLI